MTKIKKLHVEITAVAKDDWQAMIWASFPGNDFAKIIHTSYEKSFKDIMINVTNFVNYDVEFVG